MCVRRGLLGKGTQEAASLMSKRRPEGGCIRVGSSPCWFPKSGRDAEPLPPGSESVLGSRPESTQSCAQAWGERGREQIW